MWLWRRAAELETAGPQPARLLLDFYYRLAQMFQDINNWNELCAQADRVLKTALLPANASTRA